MGRERSGGQSQIKSCQVLSSPEQAFSSVVAFNGVGGLEATGLPKTQCGERENERETTALSNVLHCARLKVLS